MLYPHFKKYISDHCQIVGGERVLLGVSGGVDSMVLMHLISRVTGPMSLEVTVAHVNYGLRGKDSDADEALVKRMAAGYGFDFELMRAKISRTKGIQLEAREVRRHFFTEIAVERSCDVVCLAHTRDDQAETVLLHLLRGSGPAGLVGMRAVANMKGLKLARPLLFARRKDIEAYAKRESVKFRRDRTNAIPKYSRNAVRLELIPKLSKFNPNIVDAIAGLSDVMASEEEAMNAIAAEAYRQAQIAGDGSVVLMRGRFIEFPKAIRSRVLRAAFGAIVGTTKELNADQVERMDAISLAQNGKASYRLPSKIRFERAGERLSFIRCPTSCDR